MPTAIITGASRGLGLALADSLADRGWRLVIDARDGVALEQAAAGLRARTEVVALAGDVGDTWHRRALVAAAEGTIDLLVNNASTLGPSPLPPLARYPLDELEQVFRINALAPLALMQEVLPLLADSGRIVNVTSDAAASRTRAGAATGPRRPRSSRSARCSPRSSPRCASTRSTRAT